MEIIVKKVFGNDIYTISKMFIDGVYFCDVLEDTIRVLPSVCPNTPKGIDCKCPQKVKGKTAIPAGRYRCAFNISNRFNKKLLLLLNVPHFIGIRVHGGNTAVDTEGCLLLGENKVKGKVINSTRTIEKFNEIIEKEFLSGKEIWVTIQR